MVRRSGTSGVCGLGQVCSLVLTFPIRMVSHPTVRSVLGVTCEGGLFSQEDPASPAALRGGSWGHTLTGVSTQETSLNAAFAE